MTDTQANKKKLILIDGNSLLYRAFFALPTSLATSSGQVTNAVFGFTSMLIKLIEMTKPDAIVAAFDKGRAFRHDQYEEYKAHRKPTDHQLVGQFPISREILAALRIPVVEMDGFEADDVIASMAKAAETKQCEVIVVTSDRDAFQLISPNVKIMTNRKGITDIVIYDEQKLQERYGIPVDNIKDMLGLKGDPSDNIPGVPGIGEKTAIKLVQEFGTVEEILHHVAEVTPRKARESLKEHGQSALMSKQLATLKEDLDFGIDLEKLRWEGWDESACRQVFESLEFQTLLNRLLALKSGATKVEPTKTAYSMLSIAELANKIANEKDVAIATDDSLSLISAASKDNVYLSETNIPNEVNELQNLFESSTNKSFSNYKRLLNLLDKLKIKIGGNSFDTSIAAYLIDPSHTDYSLKRIAKDFLKIDVPELADDIDIQTSLPVRAKALYDLTVIFKKELQEKDQTELFVNVEMPLAKVLADMENIGIAIDCDYLKDIGVQMEDRIEILKGEIYKHAGGEFNINSPQQLAEVLYDKLGLRPRKKTKTGLATGASVLIEMIDEHPAVQLVLEYRELTKLKGTYLDALPKLVNPKTKRLHTTFHQTVTTTGRLSSTNPNLQNIPVRTKLGQEIRRAFVPGNKDFKLLVADYKQIELRILAHLSQDPILIEAFEKGEDVHSRTASEVFNVTLDKVDSAMRRSAKAVNFGIVYGISPYGLAEQLRILPDEAQKYIGMYFDRYKKVKEFIDNSIASAYRDGYTTTILNRRRYLPELTSSNFRVKNFGERLAVNTPVQGSAADIIKLAMVKLHQFLESKNFKSKLILQIHDELIVEVHLSEIEEVSSALKDIMENVYPIKPNLEVSLAVGDNWREAK